MFGQVRCYFAEVGSYNKYIIFNTIIFATEEKK